MFLLREKFAAILGIVPGPAQHSNNRVCVAPIQLIHAPAPSHVVPVR